jgi:two-component system chemotaxis response regulator CheB
VVASAGGLKAISALLSGLPADFPAPLLVVQHLSPDRPSLLAEVLAAHTALSVTQAADGDAPMPGHVYVAPPDRHLLARSRHALALSGADRVRHVRPAGDVLFRSVAACFGAGAVAVVLTGGNGGGADGLRAVKAAGGVTIAQDEASSEAFSMPRAAAATGAVDHVLPLDALAPMLVSLARPAH